jgi:hypothetical protein
MEKKTRPVGTALDIEIEELEAKLAPDGGETVLPLMHGKH